MQLSLVGENGSVVATVDDPGGADGHAYYVGTDMSTSSTAPP